MKKYLLSLFLVIYSFAFSQTEIPTVEIKENPKTEVTTVTAPKNKEYGVLNIGVTKVKTKPVFATKIEEGKITFELEKEEGDYLYHVVGKTENLPRVARVNNKDMSISGDKLKEMEYTYSVDTTDEKIDVLNINIASIKNKEPFLYIGRVDEKNKRLLSVFSYRRNIISELASITGISGTVKGDFITNNSRYYLGAARPNEVIRKNLLILVDEWWISSVHGGFANKEVEVWERGTANTGGSNIAKAEMDMFFNMKGIANYANVQGHYDRLDKAPDGVERFYGENGFEITKFYSIENAYSTPFNAIWGPTTLTADIELIVPEVAVEIPGMANAITCGTFEVPQSEFARTVTVDGVTTTSRHPAVLEFLVQRDIVKKEIFLSPGILQTIQIGGIDYYLYPMSKFKELGYDSIYRPIIGGSAAVAGMKFIAEGLIFPKNTPFGEYTLTVKMLNEYGDSLQYMKAGETGDILTISFSNTNYYEGEALLDLTVMEEGSWGLWTAGSTGGMNDSGSGYKLFFNSSSGRLFDVRDTVGNLKIAKLVVTREDGTQAVGTTWVGNQMTAQFKDNNGKSILRFGIQKNWDADSLPLNGGFFINKDGVYNGDTKYVIEPFDAGGNRLGKLTLTIADFNVESAGVINIEYDENLLAYMKSVGKEWATADGGIGETNLIIKRELGEFIKMTATPDPSGDINVGFWYSVSGRDYGGYASGYELYVDGTTYSEPRIALPVEGMNGLEKLGNNIVYNLKGLNPGSKVTEVLRFYDSVKGHFRGVTLNISVTATNSYKKATYFKNLGVLSTNFEYNYNLNKVRDISKVDEITRLSDDTYSLDVAGDIYGYNTLFDSTNPNIKHFTVEIKRDTTAGVASEIYKDTDIFLDFSIDSVAKNTTLLIQKLSNIAFNKNITAIIKYKKVPIAEINLNLNNTVEGNIGEAQIYPEYTDAPIGSKFEFAPSKGVADIIRSTDGKVQMLIKGAMITPYDGGTTSTITKLIVVKNGAEEKSVNVTKGTNFVVVDYPDVKIGFNGNNFYVEKKAEDYNENVYEIMALSGTKRLGTFSVKLKNTYLPAVVQDTVTITIDRRLHRYIQESSFSWLEVSTGKLSDTASFPDNFGYLPLIKIAYTDSAWSGKADRWNMATNREMLASSINGLNVFSEVSNPSQQAVIIRGISANTTDFINNLIINVRELKIGGKLETIFVGSDGTNKIPIKLIIEDGTRDVSNGTGQCEVDPYKVTTKETVQIIPGDNNPVPQELKKVDGEWLYIDIPNNPSNADYSRYIYTTMGVDGAAPTAFSGVYNAKQKTLSEGTSNTTLSPQNSYLYSVVVPQPKGKKDEILQPTFIARKAVVYNHNYTIQAYFRPDPSTLKGMVKLGEFTFATISKGTTADVTIEFTDFPVGEWIAWDRELWKLSGNVPGRYPVNNVNFDPSKTSLNILSGSFPVHQYIKRDNGEVEYSQVFKLSATEDGKYVGSRTLEDGQTDEFFKGAYSGQSIMYNLTEDVYFGYGGYVNKDLDLGGCFYISRPAKAFTPKVKFKNLKINCYDHNNLLYGVINLKLLYTEIRDLGTIEVDVDGRFVEELVKMAADKGASNKPLLSADGKVDGYDKVDYSEYVKVKTLGITIPAVSKWIGVEGRINVAGDTNYSLETGQGLGVVLPPAAGQTNTDSIVPKVKLDVYDIPIGSSRTYTLIYEGNTGTKGKFNIKVNVTNPYDKAVLKINPLNGQVGSTYTFANAKIAGDKLPSIESPDFIAKLIAGKFASYKVPNMAALETKAVTKGDIDTAYRYKIDGGGATGYIVPLKTTKGDTITLVNAKGNTTDNQYIKYTINPIITTSYLPYKETHTIETLIGSTKVGDIEIQIEAKAEDYNGSATLDISTLNVGDFTEWKSADIWGDKAPTVMGHSTNYRDFTDFVPKFFVINEIVSGNVDVAKLVIVKNNLETKEVEGTAVATGIEFNDGVKIAVTSNGLRIEKTSNASLGEDTYAITAYRKDGTRAGTFTVKVIKGNNIDLGEIVLRGKKPILLTDIGTVTGNKWLGKAGKLTDNPADAIGDTTYTDSYWSVENNLIAAAPSLKEWLDMTYREVMSNNDTSISGGSWTVFSQEGKSGVAGVYLSNGTNILDIVENGVYKYSEFGDRSEVKYTVVYRGTDNKNYSFTLRVIPNIINSVESSAVIDLSNKDVNNSFTFYNSKKIENGTIPSEEDNTLLLTMSPVEKYIPEFDWKPTYSVKTNLTGATVATDNTTGVITITTSNYKIEWKGRETTKKVGAITVTKLTDNTIDDNLTITASNGVTNFAIFNLNIKNTEKPKESSATLDLTNVRSNDNVIWRDALVSEKISTLASIRNIVTNVEIQPRILEFPGISLTDKKGDNLYIIDEATRKKASKMVIEYNNNKYEAILKTTITSTKEGRTKVGDDLSFEVANDGFLITKDKDVITPGEYKFEFFDISNQMLGRTILNIVDSGITSGEVKLTLDTAKVLTKTNKNIAVVGTDGKVYENLADFDTTAILSLPGVLTLEKITDVVADENIILDFFESNATGKLEKLANHYVGLNGITAKEEIVKNISALEGLNYAFWNKYQGTVTTNILDDGAIDNIRKTEILYPKEEINYRTLANKRVKIVTNLVVKNNCTLGEGSISISGLNIGGKIVIHKAVEDDTLTENTTVKRYTATTTASTETIDDKILEAKGYMFSTSGDGLTYKYELKNKLNNVWEEIPETQLSNINNLYSIELKNGDFIISKLSNSLTDSTSLKIKVYKNNFQINEFILNLSNREIISVNIDLTKVRKGDTVTWDNANYPTSQNIKAILPFGKEKVYNGVTMTSVMLNYSSYDIPVINGKNKKIKRVVFNKAKTSEVHDVTADAKGIISTEYAGIKFIVDVENNSFSIQKLEEKFKEVGYYDFNCYDENGILLAKQRVGLKDSTTETLVREETRTLNANYKFMVPAEFEKVQYVSNGAVYMGDPLGVSNVASYEIKDVLSSKANPEGTYTGPLDLIGFSTDATFSLDTTKKQDVTKPAVKTGYGIATIENTTPDNVRDDFVWGIPLESDKPVGTGDIYIKIPDNINSTVKAIDYNIHWRTPDNTLVYGKLKTSLSNIIASPIGSGTLDMSSVANGANLSWEAGYNITTGATPTNTIKITKGTEILDFTSPLGHFFPTITSGSRLETTTAANYNIPNRLIIRKKNVDRTLDKTVDKKGGTNLVIATTANDFPDVRFSILNGRFILKKLKRMESAIYEIEAYNSNGKLGTFELTLQDKQLETNKGTVTYKIYDKLKYVIANDTPNIKWIGGTNGQTLYSYDSTTNTLKASTEKLYDYLERSGTVTLPPLNSEASKYKFVGVEKDRTVNADGTVSATALTEITSGIYGINGIPEIDLGTAMVSTTGITADSINLDDIKINVTKAGKYSIKFLNEEDGDIYYFDVVLATKDVYLEAEGNVSFEGVARGSTLVYNINGKKDKATIEPESLKKPVMTIKAVDGTLPEEQGVPYLEVDEVPVYYAILFEDNKGNLFSTNRVTTNTWISTESSQANSINDYLVSKVNKGKLELKKVAPITEDMEFTYTFYGKRSSDGVVDKRNLMGVFTLKVPKETPKEKKVTLSIDSRLLDEVGTTYDGVNLSGLKALGTTTEYLAGDLTSFVENTPADNTTAVNYQEIGEVLGVYKVTTTDAELTKGADKGGMSNYGDSVYLAKTSSATTVEELLKELYFNPSNLKLTGTELTKTVTYKIYYIGKDNFLYNLTIDVVVKKGVVIDGNDILDFGKLLFDDKNPLHYGETNIVVKGLTKNKKVKIDIPTAEKNIELLSGTNMINVKNLDVGLITPTPTVNDKKLSEATVQDDGKATFKIWGYAEVLKDTPVGIYEGKTTVEVYIVD